MLSTIALVAITTYMTRCLPFVLLHKYPLSPRLEHIIDALPYATISLLVVYSLKDVSRLNSVPTSLALLVLVSVHCLKRNAVLSIVVSTIAYMLLV